VAQEIGSGSGPAASFLPLPPATPRTLSALAGLSMRRAGGRRAVSAVTVLLMLSGVSMFAFPAITDALNKYQQRQVKLRLGDPTFQQLYEEHRIPVGKGLTRLVIDNSRVKVNTVVVEGTTLAALQAGAGHYVDTPFPCEMGNVGIAGHHHLRQALQQDRRDAAWRHGRSDHPVREVHLSGHTSLRRTLKPMDSPAE